MVRYSFLVRLSHPLLHAGLSRRIFDHPIRPRQYIRRNRRRNASKRSELAEGVEANRIPIRRIFFACCASAEKQSANTISATSNRLSHIESSTGQGTEMVRETPAVYPKGDAPVNRNVKSVYVSAPSWEREVFS